MIKLPRAGQRVGFILSGGGARGFAHIGALRVLEQHGLKPDVLAGTSMGAIVAALYAAGYTADELEDLVLGTTMRDIVDLSLQGGLLKGARLVHFLREHLPPDFSDLKIPLAVTTTDVETGEQVLITQGDLATAVRASSSFPGAFEPEELDGRVLADGGIVNNLPVEAAAMLGASWTVALDVTPGRRAIYTAPEEEGHWWERMLKTVRLERRNPLLQMLLRSSDIMQSILTEIQYSLHPANLLIKMELEGVRIEAFWEAEAIIKLGEEAALAACRNAGLRPAGQRGELPPPPAEAAG